MADERKTRARVPVYLPSTDGQERVLVGEATVDGNNVNIEFNNQDTAQFLVSLIGDGLLRGVSFSYLASQKLEM